MRGTGGNQFIPGTATKAEVLAQAWKQLDHLEAVAATSGRMFDVGRMTIDTKRVGDRISVTVEADLSP